MNTLIEICETSYQRIISEIFIYPNSNYYIRTLKKERDQK